MVRIDSFPGVQVEKRIEELISKAAESVILMEGGEDCEVSVFLVDDVEIRRLNKLYRNIDRPTDVLAFAMREGVDGDLNREILGDVVISLPTAKRQASAYGHSFEAEILLLASHGVLHLLGYDHGEKEDMLAMQEKQKKTLLSLGYGSSQLGDIAVRMAEPASGAEGQVIRA